MVSAQQKDRKRRKLKVKTKIRGHKVFEVSARKLKRSVR
jgi:hypothetical protein